MSSQPNASLRVRISGDLADIKRDLALLKGVLRDVKQEAGKPLPRNDVIKEMGVSAGQTAAALRQLPMQFTDIFVGLASGQRPMMVLLQQGGQLKDAFGGVGAALKASLGYLVALINPVTVGAAAIGAFAVAAYKGSNESTEFAKALAGVGDVTGRTTGELIALSEEMDRGVVTQGKAAAALLEVVRNSAIAGENYRAVALAAIAMEQATGQSVEKTVEEFAKLAAGPSEAVAKLNQEHHFLTAAVYEQIRALEEQGRVQEAARVATEAYADAVIKRAADMKEELGLLETAWANLKLGAAGAWDAMLGVGRDKSPQRQFDELFAKLQEVENPSNAFSFAHLGPKGSDARRKYAEALRAQLRAMQEANVAAQKEANEAALRQQANDAAVAQQDQLRQMATQAEKKAREIARINEDARKAIFAAESVGDADLARKLAENRDKLLKAVEAKYAKKTPAKANADQTSAESLIATIERQITTNQQLADTGEKVTASDRLAIQARQLLADKTNTMTASTRKLLEALLPQLEASDQAAEATLRQAKAAEALARQQAILEAQASNRARSNELDLMDIGHGSDVTAQLRRLLAIEREYQDELKRIGDRGVADDKDTWDALAKNAARHRDEQLERERAYQSERVALMSDWRNGARAAWEDYVFEASNSARQAQDVLRNAFAGAEDAFVQFVTTGKASFKDLANSIIADLARIQFKQAVVGALSSWFPSLFGSTAAAGSGVVKNALGGVYDSPSLSAYSGKVYDSPRLFAFAKGVGMFAEAGPEAIMPLQRDAQGVLGVKAIGGAAAGLKLEVNVDNRGSTPMEASVDNVRFEGDRLVVGIVARDIAAGGAVAGAIERVYGSRRQGY